MLSVASLFLKTEPYLSACAVEFIYVFKLIGIKFLKLLSPINFRICCPHFFPNIASIKGKKDEEQISPWVGLFCENLLLTH